MSTTDVTSPRIYVASLTDYNAGRLHGAWIDATLEPDEIWAEVQKMLAASPEARAFPIGGPAEEWAIHDHEGFGPHGPSEWEQFETVSKLAQSIEEHGEPFLAWLSIIDDADKADDFEDHFRGEHASEEEYAAQTVEEIGWGDVPAHVYLTPYAALEDHVNIFDALSSYIDWESIAREMFQHGNYSSAPAGGGAVYVFEDEV